MHVRVRELGNLTIATICNKDRCMYACVCMRMRMKYLYMSFDYQYKSVRAYKIMLMLLLTKTLEQILRAVL